MRVLEDQSTCIWEYLLFIVFQKQTLIQVISLQNVFV